MSFGVAVEMTVCQTLIRLWHLAKWDYARDKRWIAFSLEIENDALLCDATEAYDILIR